MIIKPILKIILISFIFIIVFYLAFNKPDIEGEKDKPKIKKDKKLCGYDSIFSEKHKCHNVFTKNKDLGFYKCFNKKENITYYYDEKFKEDCIKIE